MKKVLLVILLLLVSTFVIAQIVDQDWTIEDNKIYIDDSKVYISASPHTLSGNGWVTFNFTSKVYDGNVDIVLGLNTTTTKVSRFQIYNPKLKNVTKSFTCQYDYFNYTSSPKHAWCYENISTSDEFNTTQGSYLRLAFERDFESGNLPQKTIYWNEEEIIGWEDSSQNIYSENHNYGGMNKWHYIKDIPIQANKSYEARVYFTVPLRIGANNGKYWFVIKPSSESISESISEDHFYALDPWWNSTYSNCRNLSLENNLDIDNAILEYNLTGLTFSNTSEIRIVNISCGETGEEVKRTILSNTSTTAYTTFIANLSGVNLTYSVYYNNSNAPVADELVDDFCEFNNNCSWNINSVNTGDPTFTDGIMNISASGGNGGAYSPKDVGMKSVYMRYFTILDQSVSIALQSGLSTMSNGTNPTTGTNSSIVNYVDVRSSRFRSHQLKVCDGVGCSTSTMDNTTNQFSKWVTTFLSADFNGRVNGTLFNDTDLVNSSLSDGINNATDSEMHLMFLTFQISGGIPNVAIDFIRAYDIESRAIVNGTQPNLTIGNEEVFVDIINPNVTINTPQNISHSTTTIDFNITAIDEDRIDSCFFTLNSGVTNTTLLNTTTNDDYNFTNSSMAQGSHTAKFFCNDSIGNINNSESVTFIVDTIPPSINIVEPQNNSNHADNNTIELNYTVSDISSTVDTCRFRVDIISPPSEAIGNTTIVDCLNTTFGLPSGDEDYKLTFFTNDSLDNKNSTVINFGIRTNVPAIVLDSPTDNQFFNNRNNIFFNFTATDSDGLDTCDLYGNWTGTFEKNFTWVNPTNATQNFTQVNITQGEANYKYNVFCNDTLDNGAFAATNFTFSIDETLPNVTINSIFTTEGSQTVVLNYSMTDLNLNECFYSIFNSSGDIDGANENVSITCGENLAALATASGFKTFNLTVYGRDKALNENSSTSEFTTTEAQPGSPGSGGAAVVIGAGVLEATNFSITTRNFKSNMDVSLAKDSVKPRRKDFIIINQGIDPIKVDIICSTEDINESEPESTPIEGGLDICDFVELSDESAIISAIEENRFEGYFDILLPPNSKIGDEYFFNILAIRETDEGTKFSKLSVSARVTTLATLSKWSYILGQSDKPKEERSSYPVALVSLLIAFGLFIGTVFLFRIKDLVLTGFFVGLGIFIIAFIGLLVIL